VGGLDDWEAALAPHYDEAERMLGVAAVDGRRPRRPTAARVRPRDRRRRDYAKTRVGVFFGEPGVTVPDPFFGGAGPTRTAACACGRCMVGCPHNAKNTLVKNYLWLPSARARDQPERTVVDIRPLGAPDGSRATRSRPSARGLAAARPATCTARGVVSPPARSARTSCSRAARLRLAAARLGPPRRARAHELGGDPRRHAAQGRAGLTKRVAITSSVYPDPDTHIETVTYGDAATR
jgi:cholesterol oxidase